jgi:hypothetical protein
MHVSARDERRKVRGLPLTGWRLEAGGWRLARGSGLRLDAIFQRLQGGRPAPCQTAMMSRSSPRLAKSSGLRVYKGSPAASAVAASGDPWRAGRAPWICRGDCGVHPGRQAARLGEVPSAGASQHVVNLGLHGSGISACTVPDVTALIAWGRASALQNGSRAFITARRAGTTSGRASIAPPSWPPCARPAAGAPPAS